MTRIEPRQEGGAPGTGFEGHPWGAREEVRSILNVLQELTTEASLGQGASGEQHVMSRTLVWIGFFAALLEATLVIITGTVFGLQVIELAGFSTAGARGLFFSSGISGCKVDDKNKSQKSGAASALSTAGSTILPPAAMSEWLQIFPL